MAFADFGLPGRLSLNDFFPITPRLGLRAHRCGLRFISRGAVLLEDACRRKFTEFVTHHIFQNKNVVKNFSVVHGERQTHKVRGDRAAPRPGLDRNTVILTARGFYLLEKSFVYEHTFFCGTAHFLLSLTMYL